MAFFDRLTQTIRENRFVVAAGTFAAIFELFQSLLKPIENIVISDALIISLVSIFVYSLFISYFKEAIPTWKFAKSRLNQNAIVYTFTKTWRSIIFSLSFMVLGVYIFASDPIFAMVDHLRLHNGPPKYCVRVSTECRSCVSLLDIGERQTGPACLQLDAGGLALGELKRWSEYRAFGASSTCSNQVSKFSFTQKELNSCEAYIGQ